MPKKVISVFFLFAQISKQPFLAQFLQSLRFQRKPIIGLDLPPSVSVNTLYLTVLCHQHSLNIDVKVTGKQSFFTWVKCYSMFSSSKVNIQAVQFHREENLKGKETRNTFQISSPPKEVIAQQQLIPLLVIGGGTCLLKLLLPPTGNKCLINCVQSTRESEKIREPTSSFRIQPINPLILAFQYGIPSKIPPLCLGFLSGSCVQCTLNTVYKPVISLHAAQLHSLCEESSLVMGTYVRRITIL